MEHVNVIKGAELRITVAQDPSGAGHLERTADGKFSFRDHVVARASVGPARRHAPCRPAGCRVVRSAQPYAVEGMLDEAGQKVEVLSDTWPDLISTSIPAWSIPAPQNAFAPCYETQSRRWTNTAQRMNDCHARRRLGGSLNAGCLLFEVRGETSLPTPHPGRSAFNDVEGRNGEHADDQGIAVAEV